MNQRALERDALPHAAREARHRIVGAIVEARLLEGRRAASPGAALPYSAAKNARFSRAVSSG